MITLAGRLCHLATLAVPWRGRWVATAALDGDVPTGRVTMVWGSATLIGTVEPESSSSWQGEARVTIIGGAGWGRVLPTSGGWMQNDAGLGGLAVASQLATLVGETLSAPASAFRPLSTSYARPRRPAAVSLADVLVASSTWWVELDGTTLAGVRPSPAVPAGVEILALDPLRRFVELDAADPSQVLVGAVFPAAPPRRPFGYRIMELRAEAGPDGQRILASVERMATT